MEMQWPLILFTLFMAWSAGVFGTAAVLALAGGGKRVQMPALVTSVVLLAVGGIAVFFHLEHWDRIFNGFGNPTSGITQELIVIVLMAVVMVVYFVYLRKPEPVVPRWLAVAAIVVSVALVVVMSHSYNMAARPVWDSPLLWLAYLGNAALFGPLTVTLLAAIFPAAEGGSEGAPATAPTEAVARAGSVLATSGVVGAVANAVLSVAWGASVVMSAASFTEVGLYWDPTHPNYPIANPAEAANILSGEASLLFWIGVVVIGCAVPVVCAVLGRRKGAPAVPLAGVGLACAIVGAVCLRMVFYSAGASVFMFY